MTLLEKHGKIFNCVELPLQPHKKGFKNISNITLMASLRLQRRFNMKAVISTGGKQYYVEEGSVLYLEKIDAPVDSTVTFDEVLMIGGTTGTPLVKGAKVEAKVLKQGKSKKIKVYKYRQKKKYRRTQGHRQPYTKVEITKLVK